MSKRIEEHGLSIDRDLYALLADEIAPQSGVAPAKFWRALAGITEKLGGKNRALLQTRIELQRKLDAWHRARPGMPEPAEYKKFLQQTGYLHAPPKDFRARTENVDDEIARIAGPQLVVPVDNARYALNAANARWQSLYDALYATDVILEDDGAKRTKKYNPVRGAKVIHYAREFLDRALPLAAGSHAHAVRYKVRAGNLVVQLGDGGETELALRECFAGYRGDPESPSSILLRNNNLHVELRIGEGYYIGRGDLAGVYDVRVESAITAIMDCEDSVAAVDAADKTRVYRNWHGLMSGALTASIEKNGERSERALQPDLEFTSPGGGALKLRARSLMFVRHVGAHMHTGAVTMNGKEIPEIFLDAMFTTLSAKHDLLGNGKFRNSENGGVYAVKPKMHGPEEVAAAVELFAHVETALDLPPGAIKIGVMDEERRTSVNLEACIAAAAPRIAFINSGFLDRTGDEIHTCMEAGAVLPKNDMKNARWLLAYEDRNVGAGLAAGLPGRAQIGKGMWAAPDNMAEMIEQKIAHPRAGASTSWVPSPTAAALHALHYHYVDVAARQQALLENSHAGAIDDVLTLPLQKSALGEITIARELENNAQSILGYVVRWVDRGIGCSKVPDIADTPLMEDRATLRISSQHIANWLHHGMVTREQVTAAFQKMAAVVDRQNDGDARYQKMSPHFDGDAFAAALDLVFRGREIPNGYTEPVLHEHRRKAKQKAARKK